jgi:hypothetical protein
LRVPLAGVAWAFSDDLDADGSPDKKDPVQVAGRLAVLVGWERLIRGRGPFSLVKGI